jgi:DNA-binding transcriptional LysR family regulator
VEACLALAVVPRLAVEAAGSAGVVAIALRDPGVLRRLGVVSRRGVPLTAAAEALLGLLRRHFRTRRDLPMVAGERRARATGRPTGA